jgi:outer membrane murein-binding lipoprotein Lpp
MKFLSDGFADVTKVVKLDKHISEAATLARTLNIAINKLASEMQSTVSNVDSASLLWLY